ncbi:MAG: Unknown protein, partial [uncultured Sulfurovum sp.]
SATSTKAISVAPIATQKANLMAQTTNDGSFSLPDAKSGMCYGKVVIPAQYKTISEKIEATPADTRLTIIPATYKSGSERILDTAASTQIVTVPATYKTESRTITVSPAYTEWRNGLHPEARVASSAVLSSAKEGGINLDTAQAGSCYYEFYAAPTFKTTSEKVLATAASTKLIAQPASFKQGSKKVLVTPASTKLVKVPAVYKTVTERVQTAPASKVWKETKCTDSDCTVEEMMCLVDIPAVYKTVSKQVIVTPETTKSITIPAVYKTVQSTVVANQASTKTVNIPATYKTLEKTSKVSDARYVWSDSLMEKDGLSRTSAVICKVAIPAVNKVITKQVVATPATSKTISIPATYKTVEVTKLLTPETTKKTVIPATYETLTKQVKVSEQSVKWMPVLCKSSMTIETISNIQKALTSAGFPTPVTGSLDAATKASVEAYQMKKGLTVSGLSINTLKDLGVL